MVINYSEYNLDVENHVAKPSPTVEKTVWTAFGLLAKMADLLNMAKDLSKCLANFIFIEYLISNECYNNKKRLLNGL